MFSFIQPKQREMFNQIDTKRREMFNQMVTIFEILNLEIQRIGCFVT
jgi:hypothetical protein